MKTKPLKTKPIPTRFESEDDNFLRDLSERTGFPRSELIRKGVRMLMTEIASSGDRVLLAG